MSIKANSPILSFFSEDTNFKLKDIKEEKIMSWIMDVIALESKDVSSLNYIFCSDDYLLEINRTHLNHDYYTDIITFPLQKDPIESDIFISIDRVKDNAKTLGLSFDEELYRVMIHGVLHLCGYEDHSDEEKRVMRAKEDKCLSLLTSI